MQRIRRNEIFTTAFAAGLVATVNPCGFAMLPAYLSYFMGLEDGRDDQRARAIRRALAVGGVMSLGFLVVFGVAGVLLSLGFQALTGYLRWIALGIGVLIMILGVALISGYELTLALPKAKRASTDKGYGSVFVFGLSYALASLSCTLPVFLVVVATRLTSTDFVTGVATFLVYGAGMALMMMAITVTIAIGKRSLVNVLRSWGRHINRVAGVVLVIAGGYIVWFWLVNADPGAAAESGLNRLIDSWSQALTSLIGENPAVSALALAGIILAAVVYAFVAGRSGPPSGDSGSERKRTTTRA